MANLMKQKKHKKVHSHSPPDSIYTYMFLFFLFFLGGGWPSSLQVPWNLAFKEPHGLEYLENP